MKNINDKKYSVLLFLFGLFSSIICNIISTEYYYFKGEYILVSDEPQLKAQNFEVVKFVEFLFISIKLNSILVLLTMLIALSIYTFLYKTDKDIINTLIILKTKYSDLNLKFKHIKTLRLYKKTNLPVTSTGIMQIEKTEQQIKFGKIQTLKSNALLYGFILLLIQIALYLLLKKYIAEYSTQIIINFSVSIVLRFFSAFKCNELSEYNKSSSSMWFLFGIMLPSIALIIAGMDFSIKKEWQDFQHIESTPLEQRTNKKSISKYIIYLLIITLILVTILYFKDSKSSEKQVENFAPELIDSANINPNTSDNNTAVAPDTTILNQLNSKDKDKEFAIYLEDSISRAKKEHLTEKKDIVIIDSLKKVKKSKPTFAEKLLNAK